MSWALVGKENWTQDLRLMGWGLLCGEGWEHSGAAMSRDLSNCAEPHPANSAAESWGLLQDQGHGWGMALCEDVAALVQWFHVPALCRQGGGLGAGVTFPEDGPFREQWLV